MVEVVDVARLGEVALVVDGCPVAVVMSPERYDELVDAFEELEDVGSFDSAMAESGPSIPWDVVVSAFGWA